MEASQVTNPLEEFPESVQEAVDGLVHLGHLENPNIEFAGHSFGLRTLKAGEELAAAAIIKPFRDTVKEPEAWMAAQVGLALTHVDGDDSFCPPAGPDKTAFARARFQYITNNWYPPTIDYLYSEFTKLLVLQREALAAVQGLSMRSRPTFSPSADFSTEPGISGAPINLETLT